MSQITIIISSFNQWQYLLAAVESALRVSLKNFHLIIIDDNSKTTEFDIKKLEEFIIQNQAKNLEKFLILTNSVNLGLVKSLNISLELVETDYVFFLDGDDMMPSDALKRMLVMVENDKYDIVGGLHSHIDSIDLPVIHYEIIKERLKLDGIDLFLDIVGGSLPFRFSGSLINYHSFKQIGFLDEQFDLYQDRPGILKFAINNFNFGIYDGISYYFRPNPGSMTGKSNSNNRLLVDQIVLFDVVYRKYIDYLDAKWIEDTTAKLKFIRGFRHNKKSVIKIFVYLWKSRSFIIKYFNIFSIKSFFTREF